MRIVMFPAFDDADDFVDFYYRLHWFLYPFRSEIEEIVLPVAAREFEVGRVPDLLDPSLADLVGQLNVRVARAPTEASLTDLCSGADHIFVWRTGEDGKVAGHPALKGRRTIRVDHKHVQHATSFFLKFCEVFEPLQASYLERSKQIFAEIVDSCSSKVGYVFGTGPNLAMAANHVFDDGVSIACNSMVRNYALLDRLNPPLIAVADPIFHAGPSSYAAEFRKDLVRALDKFGSYLVVPQRDYHIYLAHLPERFSNRIASLPFVPGEKPNLDLKGSHYVTTTGNILTLFLLPLAATLFSETRILGCDGRPITENSYFWGHDKASQINDKMDDIKKAHPAFFAIDFDDYYLTHCRILSTWLDDMERHGRQVINITPSHIPALEVRTTRPFVPPGDDPAVAQSRSLAARSGPPLLISIDPEVGNSFGHFTPLNDRTAEAAEELGIEYRTYGNVIQTALEGPRKYLRPHFSINTWQFRKRDFGEGQNAYGVFLKEMLVLRYALSREAPDRPIRIFMYCGSMSALEVFLDVFQADRNVRFSVNLFYSSYGSYDDPAYIKRWKSLLQRYLAGGHSLFATTEKLASGLASAFGLPVAPLPHVSPTYSDADAARILSELPAWTKIPPVLTFPAVAKAEKGGSDRLPILEKIGSDDLLKPLPLVLRAPQPGETTGRAVQIFSERLNDADYLRLVTAGDLAVLTYKGETFRDRPSGLMMDLIVNGVPVVASPDSWVADFVSRTRCGVVAKSLSPSDMCEAISTVLEDLPMFGGAARAAAREWFRQNNWRQFVLDLTCAQGEHPALAPPASVDETWREDLRLASYRSRSSMFRLATIFEDDLKRTSAGKKSPARSSSANSPSPNGSGKIPIPTATPLATAPVANAPAATGTNNNPTASKHQTA